MKRTGLVGLLAVVVSLWACTEDSARFEAQVTGDAPCFAAQFPYQPTHFAAVEAKNGALIRMFSGSYDKTAADSFTISIRAEITNGTVCQAVDELRGTVEVGPERCVQAFFRFNHSCRDEYVNAHVIGTIAFDELGFGRGDRIAGSVEGSLADVVYEEETHIVLEQEPLGTVDGSFDFEVKVGAPYQTYSMPNDR